MIRKLIAPPIKFAIKFSIKFAVNLASWLLGIVIIALISALLLLKLGEVPIPAKMRDHFAAKLSESLNAEIHLDRATISLANWRPKITIRNFSAKLPENIPFSAENVAILFQPRALMKFELHPQEIIGKDLALTITRNMDGNFSTQPSTTETQETQAALDFFAIARNISHNAKIGAFSAFKRAAFANVQLRYIDQRTLKEWVAQKGQLTLINSAEALTAELTLPIAQGITKNSSLSLSMRLQWADNRIFIEKNFDNIPAQDIAQQFTQLAWLSTFEKSISGTIAFSVALDSESVTALEGQLDFSDGYIALPNYGRLNVADLYVDFALAPDSGRIDVKELYIKTDLITMQGKSKIALNDFFNGSGPLLIEIVANRLRIKPNAYLQAPLDTESANLNLSLFSAETRMAITDSHIRIDGQRVQFSADLLRQNAAWIGNFRIDAARLASSTVKKYWPKSVAKAARRWFSDNILKATFENVAITGNNLFTANPNSAIIADYSNMQMRYLKNFPHLKNAKGHLKIQDNRLRLFIAEGKIDPSSRHSINVAGSDVVIDALRQKNNPVEITLSTKGTVPEILRLLDIPAIALIKKHGLKTDIGTGNAILKSAIRFKLKKNLTYADVDFTVKGVINDFASNRLVRGRKISAPSIDVTASQKSVHLSGGGKFDAIPVRFEWSEIFAKDAPLKSQVKGTAQLTRQSLEDFGLPFPKTLLSGETKADFVIDLVKGKALDFSLRSDLAGLSLSLPQLAWQFPTENENKGLFSLKATIDTALTIKDFIIKAGALSIRGSAALDSDWRLKEAIVKSFQFSKKDAEIDIKAHWKSPQEGASRLDITGKTIDVRAFKASAPGQKPLAANISVAIDNARFSPMLSVQKLTGNFTFVAEAEYAGYQGAFSAMIDREQISGTLTPTENGTAYYIKSENTGPILSSLGLVEDVRGGVMELRLTSEGPEGKEGALKGDIKIRSFTIVEAPLLARILSSVSLIGLVDTFTGDGIFFSELQGFFTLDKEKVAIDGAYAIGPAYGISAEGNIDLTQDMIDMSFIISPAYIFNGIFQVFSPKREGIFGLSAYVKGSLKAPEIRGNPLLIFVPGFLRDLIHKRVR